MQILREGFYQFPKLVETHQKKAQGGPSNRRKIGYDATVYAEEEGVHKETKDKAAGNKEGGKGQ
jgi:hypothetical protein